MFQRLVGTLRVHRNSTENRCSFDGSGRANDNIKPGVTYSLVVSAGTSIIQLRGETYVFVFTYAFIWIMVR